MSHLEPAYEVIDGIAVGMSGGWPYIAYRDSNGDFAGATWDTERGLLINQDATRITNDSRALGQPDTLWDGIYLTLVACRRRPNWSEVIRALGVPAALGIAVRVRPDEMEPVYQFFGQLPHRELVDAIKDGTPSIRAAAMMALAYAPQS